MLLELGINDLLEFDVISQYEHLVRGLLELKNKPALINIEYVLYESPTSLLLKIDSIVEHSLPSSLP